MKFSITPIGTDPGDGGSSAKKIVDYLFGKKATAKGERPLMGDDLATPFEIVPNSVGRRPAVQLACDEKHELYEFPRR